MVMPVTSYYRLVFFLSPRSEEKAKKKYSAYLQRDVSSHGFPRNVVGFSLRRARSLSMLSRSFSGAEFDHCFSSKGKQRDGATVILVCLSFGVLVLI